MNRRCILLRGNSGSGKSTVARQLQKQLGRGTLLISQDFVRREMLYVQDRPDNLSVHLMIQMARFGQEHCEYIIVEGILYSDYYKRLFHTLAEGYGSNLHAYYFDIPFEETLRRHTTKKNAASFGEADMKRWWREKDLLAEIQEKRIGPDASVEESVARILKDCDRTEVRYLIEIPRTETGMQAQKGRTV